MSITGKVFKIQRHSLHDGPGIKRWYSSRDARLGAIGASTPSLMMSKRRYCITTKNVSTAIAAFRFAKPER